MKVLDEIISAFHKPITRFSDLNTTHVNTFTPDKLLLLVKQLEDDKDRARDFLLTYLETLVNNKHYITIVYILKVYNMESRFYSLLGFEEENSSIDKIFNDSIYNNDAKKLLNIVRNDDVFQEFLKFKINTSENKDYWIKFYHEAIQEIFVF